MRLKKANRERLKAHRHQVLSDAFDYDMKRLARLTASGTLHKRVNSYFVRRWRQSKRRYDRFVSIDTTLTVQ